MYTEDIVTRLQFDLVEGIEEVQAENPEIECGFEIDLAVGIALTAGVDQESIIEFFRREFGYTPNQYASLRP